MTFERIYRALLRVYPPAFRREYGEAMVDAFREARRDYHRSVGHFWLVILADLVRSAAREHVRAHPRPTIS